MPIWCGLTILAAATMLTPRLSPPAGDNGRTGGMSGHWGDTPVTGAGGVMAKIVKAVFTRRRKKGAFTMIDNLLEGNRKFRDGFFKDNKAHYEELTRGQSPTVLWIGCSDSRLQTGHITQTKPGTLFMHRNIGNVVPLFDWNFATVLEYAIRHLKIRDIVVCGHSDCGAIKALDKETDDVYIPLWLNNAVEAKKRIDATIQPPKSPAASKERSEKIEKENVRLQIEHLLMYPVVKQALKDKKIQVHGLYYNLENGELTRVT